MDKLKTTDFSIIRKLFQYNEDCGFSHDEIKPLITKIGEIPEILYEYYHQLGRYEELNYTQDKLIAPNQLCVKDGYLHFYEENQGSMFWCIKEYDLKSQNPPVYVKKRIRGEDIYLLECGDATKAAINKVFNKKPFGFTKSPIITFYGNYDNQVLAILEEEGANKYQFMFGCGDEQQYLEIEKFILSMAY